MQIGDVYVLIGAFIAIYVAYWLIYLRREVAIEWESGREPDKNGVRIPKIFNDFFWFFMGTFVSIFTPEVRHALGWILGVVMYWIS